MPDETSSSRMPYYVASVTCEFTNDLRPLYLYLELRLHGRTFHIHLHEPHFTPSPARLAEFRALHANAESYFTDGASDYDDDGKDWTALCDWAPTPLRPRLDSLALAAVPRRPAHAARPLRRSRLPLRAWRLPLTTSSYCTASSPTSGCSERVVPADEYGVFDVVLLADVEVLRTRLEIHHGEMQPRFPKSPLAQLPPSIYIRGLEGVVVGPGEEDVVPRGILFADLDLIEPARSRPLGVSLDTKHRWIGQLREAVAALHAIGVVWGAGSIGNVLLDQDDDLWIGGFGYGYSAHRWIVPDKSPSVERELEAVDKLVTWIMEADSGPRSKL